MPAEIAELLDRYLTAMQNSVTAEDAADAAEAEYEAARERAGQLREAQSAAAHAESDARAAYRASLTANGYVDTASGPQPAPGYTQWGPLAPCGCPAQYLADHGSHQEGCESGERARSLGEQYRGRL